jgi:hypothetical protein
MSRYAADRRAFEAPSRDFALEDVRKLAKTNMRHRDLAGLAGLMDDYLALADELEVVSQSAESLESARANDAGSVPPATVSTVTATKTDEHPAPRAA